MNNAPRGWCHLSSINSVHIVLIVLAALAAASIWAVDINFPLTDSHYRPSGTAVPAIVLVAALVARFAFLIAILLHGSRRLTKPTTCRTNGDQ